MKPGENAPRHEADARHDATHATVFFHPDCEDAVSHPTVGSGIGPDLLTFRLCGGSARGLVPACSNDRNLPPVGNFAPP